MFEYRNLAEAVRRLRQRLVFVKRRALVLDVCLVGGGVSLLATVAMTLAGWPVPRTVVYGMLLLGVLLVLALLVWRVRVSNLALLQCADRVLHLQERLSTAHEYLERDPAHPFLPGLVAEAERVAPQVEARRVFPTRLPQRLWGIPVLFAVLVAWLWLDVGPFRFNDLAESEAEVEVRREGERLERWGRRLEDLAKQQRLDRSMILARHMQDLGRRLQHEEGEKNQAAKRISTLSQYLQRMHQELRERTLMSEVSFSTAQDVLMSGKSVKQELQDILQLLQGDNLPREMAAAAEQGVLRLSQQLGNRPELENLVRNLQAGNVQAARQLLQDILQQQQAAEDLEQLERAQRALEYSSRSIQRGEGESEAPTSDSPLPGDTRGGDFPLDFDDDGMSEDMPTMEDFATPGADAGYGVARHARDGRSQGLQESQQPPSQVQVQSGEGAMRLAYIRNLPMQNDVQAPLEDVVVRYQHAAEAVLDREEIPRIYHEQVKQYFLSIGMMPSSKP